MKAAALAALALSACGGAAPLLHPAQVLKAGDVRGMAGVAARAAVGGLGDSLRNATDEAAAANAQGSPPTIDATYAKGALVAAAIAPDLSPAFGARVGVGSGFEGGLMYTGRGVRVDLRRAFPLPIGARAPDQGRSAWALSVGLGLDSAFSGRQTSTLGGVDNANLLGFGADIPVLVGWHSTADLYYLWIGARLGYEHDTIAPRSSETLPMNQNLGPTLTGDRISIGGLAGIALGFRHIHVALELEADYAYVTGTFGGSGGAAPRGSVDGLSLTPATAVWLDF